MEIIEGLTRIEGPSGAANRMAGSKFALPPGFDTSKYASAWIEEGPQVQEAMQEVYLESEGVKAQGWQIFKIMKPKKVSDEKDEKSKPEMVPCTRAIGKAVYVLMYRPKKLQQALNIIYANQSRRLVQQEIRGDTVAANESGDPGIITAAELSKFSKEATDEDGVPYLKTTPLAGARTPQEATELKLA